MALEAGVHKNIWTVCVEANVPHDTSSCIPEDTRNIDYTTIKSTV